LDVKLTQKFLGMSLEEAKGFYHDGLDKIEMDFVKLLVIQGTANVSLVS
jgi:hypothetical protein